MNDLTKARLKRIARLLHDWGAFPSWRIALKQLTKDYKKGQGDRFRFSQGCDLKSAWPTDLWIKDVLDNKDRLVHLDYDHSTQEYEMLKEGQEENEND